MSGAIVAASIAGAASIGGGLLAAHGASSAADSTLQASQGAVAENRRQFDLSQQNIQPWLNSGGAALGRLDYLMGLNPGTSSQGAYNANYGPQGAAPGSTTAHVTAPANGTFAGRTSGGGGIPGKLGPGAMTSSMQGNFSETPIGRNGGPPIGTPPFVATPGAPPTVGPAGGAVPQGTSPATSAPAAAGPNDPNSFGSLMHDFSAADFQADPGYLFRLSEGQKALDRSAAAKGVLGSGGYLKDLTDYNQGSASNEFGNAYNRFQSNRQTRYNFLSGLAGGGQQSAQQVGQLGAQYAGINSQTLMNSANNAANLRASGYNALAGTVAGLPGTVNAGYNSQWGRG